MSLKERIYSVLVVSAADKPNNALVSMLPESHYGPVQVAISISAAKRLFSERSFDFVIINSPLPDDVGTKFAVDAGSTAGTVVLLIVRAEDNNDIRDKVTEYGVFTIPKPLSKPVLSLALDWMASTREHLRKLEKKTLSVEEKMERGRMALDALAAYREYKGDDPEIAVGTKRVLDAHVQYMGYGHLEKPEDVVPPVGVVFWAFRLMIGLGMLCALVLLLSVWGAWKDRLGGWKWLLWTAIVCIPLVYVCGQCGWIVAEVGRQPWTIQGLLPVNVAISSLGAGAVKTTFFVFLAVFALFLAIEIRILLRAIRKGPEVEPENA